MRPNKILGGLGVVALVAIGAPLAAAHATPTAPSSQASVSLCASTNSDTHPYQLITIDAAGAHDGHLGHTGPIWNATLKDQNSSWGDIIPPFILDGQTYSLNWPAGQTIFDNGCDIPPISIPVTAVAPTFTEGTCSVDPGYSVPAEPAGVAHAVTGGVVPLWGKTVTVTFSADTGYTLTGQAVYSHTFGAQSDCRTIATPGKPDVTSAQCDHATGLVSGFSITPATTQGIGYTVNGLVVTATAESGYKLGSLPAGWISVSETVATYLVTNLDVDCLIDASPADPAFVQSVCTGPGTSSLPSVTAALTTGITYTVGSDLSTVTATLSAGYQFGELPAGWVLQDGVAVFATHLVGAGDCDVSVRPAGVTFTDDVCASNQPSGSSLTLPAITGVDFRVDGVKTASGAHPATAGSTVTVTGSAQPGYTLIGTRSWSHVFSAVPACHGTVGVVIERPVHRPAVVPPTVAPVTAALATTGVPTKDLVVLAGLLIIGGGAMYAGGMNRRWFRG